MTRSLQQSLKDRIQQIVKKTGKPFQEVWQTLVMERFLARVSRSDHRIDFIFKGGHLLAKYIDIQRVTKDLDFLIKNLKRDAKVIEAAFQKIGNTDVQDGFTFHAVRTILLTHADKKYPGLRFSLIAVFWRTRTPLTVDVGFGDIVSETDLNVSLLKTTKAPIFEDSISIVAYPPESIFAEKLQAAILKNTQNSRMKDYHDLYLLIQSDILDPKKLHAAIQKTFQARKTTLSTPPLSFSDEAIAAFNIQWSTHIAAVGKETGIPENIADVIAVINEYVGRHFK